MTQPADHFRKLICPHCLCAARLVKSFGLYRYECSAYLTRNRDVVTDLCGFRGRYHTTEASARRVWLALYRDKEQ